LAAKDKTSLSFNYFKLLNNFEKGPIFSPPPPPKTINPARIKNSKEEQ